MLSIVTVYMYCQWVGVSYRCQYRMWSMVSVLSVSGTELQMSAQNVSIQSVLQWVEVS